MEKGYKDTIEKEPTVVTTAKEILKFHIETSSNRKYRNQREAELEQLNSIPPSELYEASELHGILGEAIFLDFIRESDINIEIAEGDEDLAGMDFKLNGFEMDVTTGFNSAVDKLQPDRLPVIYLPRHYGQKHVFSESENLTKNKTYLYDYLNENFVSKRRYLYDLLTINTDVLRKLREQIENPTPDSPLSAAGVSNEINLTTILHVLWNSNLVPKKEKKINNKAESEQVQSS